MDIAAMSTMLSQGKIMQQASISVMKMAMDKAETSGNLIKELTDTGANAMEKSVNPHVGSNLDVKL